MTVTYAVTGTMVTIAAKDTLALEDVVATRATLRDDVRIPECERVVIDLTGVTHFRLSLDDLRFLAQEVSPWPATARVAFVAPSDLSFGSMRLYQTQLAEQAPPAQVFRRYAEALRWLDRSA
ncbi:MAG: hypothetical protein AAF493_09670 [Pseudomonadota bacterium]